MSNELEASMRDGIKILSERGYSNRKIARKSGQMGGRPDKDSLNYVVQRFFTSNKMPNQKHGRMASNWDKGSAVRT